MIVGISVWEMRGTWEARGAKTRTKVRVWIWTTGGIQMDGQTVRVTGEWRNRRLNCQVEAFVQAQTE